MGHIVLTLNWSKVGDNMREKKTLLKIEMWKAFHNSFFWMAISVGTVIAALEAVMTWKEIWPMMQNTLTRDIGRSFRGLSLFYLWMGIYSLSFAGNFFFFIWPVLGAVAYGWSFWKEKNEGVFYQEVLRGGRENYLNAKFTAVFVAGGICVAWPLLLNLMLEAMFLQASAPNIIHGVSPVSNGYFLAKLYYAHPWIYCFCWCVVVFFEGGAAASLCFLAGKRARLFVVVILIPYFIYMAITIACNLTGQIEAVKIAPINLINAAVGISPWVMLLETLVSIGIAYAFAYYHIVKQKL